MTAENTWRSFKRYESIWSFPSRGPVYSTSGKYLLDYKIDFAGMCSMDIVIINMEAGYMKRYAKIIGYQVVSCNYWLSDFEIVFVSQGEIPKSEEYETVSYRMYSLDHEKGTADMILKWQYSFPRFADTVGKDICTSSNPVFVNKQAFCFLQVGPELVLLPWDVRRQNPSYPPIRIRINMDEYREYNLMRPDVEEHGTVWSNYYAYGSCIYLDLRRHEDWSTVLNRYLRVDLSNLDLTSPCVSFHKESPEVSIRTFDPLNDMTDTRYHFDSTWCQGDYIVKWDTFAEEEDSSLAVINLKNGTVFTIPVYYEELFRSATFTVYENKILALRSFKDEKKIPRFQYKIIRDSHFPIQTLRQICFDKVHLTEFYDKYLLNYEELNYLTFDDDEFPISEPGLISSLTSIVYNKYFIHLFLIRF